MTLPVNIRVVIADKHEIFRQGLQSLMETLEGIISITPASNGKDAWHLIEKMKPHVAILEITMPEITGIDIAKKIEASGYPTQVIILTSCEDPVVAMAARDAGVYGYVLKSSPFETLAKAVQIVIAGGTFIAPEIRTKIRDFQRRGKKFVPLSPREREVVRLISSGNSSKQIARLMNVSPRTIDTYRDRLMRKIEAHNLSDIVRFAIRAGVIE